MVSQTIKDYYKEFKAGSVVDLGSGDGSNIAFLRSKGFGVHGVEKNYGDLIQDCITGSTFFDNRICLFTLHFLNKLNAYSTLSWMQKVPKDGVNVITTFSDKATWPQDKGMYFNADELKELYKGWEILLFEEKEVKVRDGSNQMSINLVAKKV